MLLKVRKSETQGSIVVPGSKSHTIRSFFIAGLAGGQSVITNPLLSEDTISAMNVCNSFGISFESGSGHTIVKGIDGIPSLPDNVIDVGNSGTSLRFALMTAGLIDGYTVLTGDYQIRRRPLGPLIRAMNELGGQVFSTRGNDMAPVVAKGRLKGGKASLDAVTSQYLSSILINAPLLDNDTEITITRINEVPYAEMTLWWLNNQGIEFSNDRFKTIYIKGGQRYKPFNITIPGDFSSATFFMVLAAISGGEFILKNLDKNDPQGDKMVLEYLREMGAVVSCTEEGIAIKGKGLKGIEIDMNSTPDALPAMAVAGCFAEGETRLVNVPQARLKETDRIHVMCNELGRMGADVEELPDGLIVRGGRLRGCKVSGYGDHRIVMALAVAGLNIPGETIIDTAEAMNVTFPTFPQIVRECGGDIELIDE